MGRLTLPNIDGLEPVDGILFRDRQGRAGPGFRLQQDSNGLVLEGHFPNVDKEFAPPDSAPDELWRASTAHLDRESQGVISAAWAGYFQADSKEAFPTYTVTTALAPNGEGVLTATGPTTVRETAFTPSYTYTFSRRAIHGADATVIPQLEPYLKVAQQLAEGRLQSGAPDIIFDEQRWVLKGETLDPVPDAKFTLQEFRSAIASGAGTTLAAQRLPALYIGHQTSSPLSTELIKSLVEGCFEARLSVAAVWNILAVARNKPDNAGWPLPNNDTHAPTILLGGYPSVINLRMLVANDAYTSAQLQTFSKRIRTEARSGENGKRHLADTGPVRGREVFAVRDMLLNTPPEEWDSLRDSDLEAVAHADPPDIQLSFGSPAKTIAAINQIARGRSGALPAADMEKIPVAVATAEVSGGQEVEVANDLVSALVEVPSSGSGYDTYKYDIPGRHPLALAEHIRPDRLLPETLPSSSPERAFSEVFAALETALARGDEGLLTQAYVQLDELIASPPKDYLTKQQDKLTDIYLWASYRPIALARTLQRPITAEDVELAIRNTSEAYEAFKAHATLDPGALARFVTTFTSLQLAKSQDNPRWVVHPASVREGRLHSASDTGRIYNHNGYLIYSDSSHGHGAWKLPIAVEASQGKQERYHPAIKRFNVSSAITGRSRQEMPAPKRHKALSEIAELLNRQAKDEVLETRDLLRLSRVALALQQRLTPEAYYNTPSEDQHA